MTAQSHQRTSGQDADGDPAPTPAPEQPDNMPEADIANGEQPTPPPVDSPLDTDDQNERRHTPHETGSQQAHENQDKDPPA